MDHVTNEVLQRVKEESKEGRLNGLVTSCVETAVSNLLRTDRNDRKMRKKM